MTDTNDLPRCTLARRLAIMGYDGLLLAAVLLLATALALTVAGGAAIGSHPLFRSYLFIIAFFYFAWPWVNSGQTLGMRTWRVRVQRYDGKSITWWQALLRYLVAFVSLVTVVGFLWSLFDKQKRTWHDIYSESVLVMISQVRE